MEELLKMVTTEMPNKELIDTLNDNFGKIKKRIDNYHSFSKGQFNRVNSELSAIKSDITKLDIKVNGIESKLDKLLKHFGIQ